MKECLVLGLPIIYMPIVTVSREFDKLPATIYNEAAAYLLGVVHNADYFYTNCLPTVHFQGWLFRANSRAITDLRK